MEKIKDKKTNFIAPAIVFVLMYAGIELIIRTFNIQQWILPTPTNILLTFYANFVSEILPHTYVTLKGIIIGFLIAVPLGITIAFFLSQFEILDKAFSPYVIFLSTTPLITLVPLLMIWLGFGIKVKILAVTIQTFPIIMMNSVTGFNNVETLKLELMTSLGANRLQTFFNVTLPASLPNVFTGIKLGTIFSTIAAISTEFVGGKTGLGSRIVYYTSYIKTNLAFACILAVTLIGIVLYSIVSLLEEKLVKWNI